MQLDGERMSSRTTDSKQLIRLRTLFAAIKTTSFLHESTQKASDRGGWKMTTKTKCDCSTLKLGLDESAEFCYFLFYRRTNKTKKTLQHSTTSNSSARSLFSFFNFYFCRWFHTLCSTLTRKTVRSMGRTFRLPTCRCVDNAAHENKIIQWFWFRNCWRFFRFFFPPFPFQ